MDLQARKAIYNSSILLYHNERECFATIPTLKILNQEAERMIPLDEQDFHLLQVLRRTRNITHAADELYITQSSVSKRIRQMEKELGLTLMLRSRQGSPTRSTSASCAASTASGAASASCSREHICAITSNQDKNTPLSGLPQVSRPADDDMERMLAQWMRENHLQTSANRISVNSTATCMAMVERGLGWGIVPEICLGNFHGCVRPLYFANGEPLTRSTFIMYAKQALELPQVRAFIDLIREHNKKRHKNRKDN